jgi:hypothetical protein
MKTAITPSVELQQQYGIADFWRTGWTRLACKYEAGRLQSKQDRVESRARAASRRVAVILQKNDSEMAATLAQADLRQQILDAKAAMDSATGAYWRLRAMCTHSYVEKDESAICAICEDRGGWWCPDNPSHLCEYQGGSEYCIHCGAPEERK